MNISVIIPTLNRQQDLAKTLQSIVEGTVLPDQVIIVEQGDTAHTQQVISPFMSDLLITLEYQAIPSSAEARNRGIDITTGDLVFIFDDDVFLDKEYIARALGYFETHPGIMGVTGKQTNYSDTRNIITKCLSWLFFIRSTAGRNVITWSGQQSPVNYMGDMESHAEWLQGFNMLYRRQVFDDGLRFERNFLKWSAGEDVFLSYQVYQNYPDSLRYVPQLKIEHFQSPVNRDPNIVLIRMKLVHKFIFWQRYIHKGSVLRLCAYCWCQIGLILMEVRNTRSLMPLLVSLQTHWYIYRVRKELKNGTIDFNIYIFNNT